MLTDDTRSLHVYYVQPLQHVTGMLMAWLPNERIAFEADLFDTHEAPPCTAPGDAQLHESGAADEAQCRDGGAGPWQASAVEHVHRRARDGGEDELRRTRRSHSRFWVLGSCSSSVPGSGFNVQVRSVHEPNRIQL